jgi:stage II sporulation protein AA (anti-sigma F factor antagonist)
MDCTIENAGPYMRVYLSGRLTSQTVARVYDSILRLAADPNGRVMMNLAGLEEVTRAGSRAIFVTARLLHVTRGRLAICGARPAVRRALANCGFDHAFCCFPDEEAAFAYLTRHEARHFVEDADLPDPALPEPARPAPPSTPRRLRREDGIVELVAREPVVGAMPRGQSDRLWRDTDAAGEVQPPISARN